MCTFIGSKMHISFREEISSIKFLSGGCPDGTLWLPEDVLAHGLNLQMLEIPEKLTDCTLSDLEITQLHNYLTRLCLGPDVAGGLVLRDLLNSSRGYIAGNTLGDMLSFAVHVATGGKPEPIALPEFNVTLAQGVHHVGIHDDGSPYECACMFEQHGESGFFSFVLDRRLDISNVYQKFFLRAINRQKMVIGPFTFLRSFVADLPFPGWAATCTAIGEHMQLDINSMKQALLDVQLTVTTRADPTSGVCECLVHNLFGMELTAQLTPGGEYDMSTLWCSAVNGRTAQPCGDGHFQCGQPPGFIFSSACTNRRRPQISPAMPGLAEILARDRV